MPRFHSESSKRHEQTVYTGSTDGRSKCGKVHNSTRNEKNANKPALRYQLMLLKPVKIKEQNIVLVEVRETGRTVQGGSEQGPGSQTAG